MVTRTATRKLIEAAQDAHGDVAELATRIEAAAREWREASVALAAIQPGDARYPRAGMRLNKAQNAWYVLCTPENVLRLIEVPA